MNDLHSLDMPPSTSSATSFDQSHEPNPDEEEVSKANGWFDSASQTFNQASAVFNDLKTAKSRPRLKDKMWTVWNSVKYSNTWMYDNSGDYGKQGQIVLLGRFYAPQGSDGLTGSNFSDFRLDYYSKIWITYRTRMKALAGTGKTSDCGWGCMLRTTQMMVAQAIVKNRLGRDWKFCSSKHTCILDEDGCEKKSDDSQLSLTRQREIHMQILKLFEDCPGANLGFHRLIEIASTEIGEKAIGRWYAPSEAISLVRRAVRISDSPLTGDLAVMLVVHGILRESEAEQLSHNWTKKLLIFVTIRLGTNHINKVYYPHIHQLFSMESCLGIIGGRPQHSLYFLGFYGKQVVYLDPHVAHEYSRLPDPLDPSFMNMEEGETTPQLATYHCKLVSKMPMSEMDPSCAVGFLIPSKEEFDNTFHQLNLNQVVDIEGTESKRTRDPLFTVFYGEEETPPNHQMEASEVEKAAADLHGFELL